MKVQEPVKLFQYNTLGALMAGLYGGTNRDGVLVEKWGLGVGNLGYIYGGVNVFDCKDY